MDNKLQYTIPVSRSGMLSPLAIFGLLLLLAIYVFILRSPFIHYALAQDEGLFMVVAEQWRHGLSLYRDIWDNKPPGIFAIYVLIQQILGKSVLAIHIAAGITVFFTAVTLALVAYLICGTSAAGVATMFILPVYTLDLGGEGAEPELLMMLPQSTAVYLLARFLCPVPRPNWALVSGLLFGLIEGGLFEVKFPAALEAVALSIAVLLCLAAHRVPIKTTTIFFCSVIATASVVPLGIFVTFYAAGIWPDLVYSNFISPKFYITSPFGLDHPTQSLILLVKRLSYFAPLMTMTLVYVSCQLQTIMRTPKAYVTWLLPIAWAIAAIVGASASGYYRYYYFMAVTPPAVLLGSMAMINLLKIQSRFLGTVTLAVCFAFLTVPKLVEHANKLLANRSNDDYQMQQALIPIIMANEPDTDRTLFLADITPGLYTLTGTTPATRYPQAVAHIFDLPDKFGVDAESELTRILHSNPKLIISTVNHMTLRAKFSNIIQPYLDAHYEKLIPANSWLAARVLIYKYYK